MASSKSWNLLAGEMKKKAWIATSLWWGLCVAIVAWAAGVQVFQDLPSYDDTGYVLAIIQNYNQGKRLFGEVFSQYGPFYAQYYYSLSTVISSSITHDVLGWMTVAHWTAGALLGGLAGLRLSGQLSVAVMGTLASAFSMYGLSAEPGHPVSLCLLLVMALLPLIPGPHSRSANLRLFGAGAIVGALCLTKINLGVFTGMAVALPLLAFGPNSWLRLTGVIVSWLAAFLPAVFVGPPWERGGYLALILPVTTGAVMLATAATFAWSRDEDRYSRSHVMSAALGCMAVLGISLAIELVRGSPASVLWDGIIRRPLELPSVFFISPPVPMFLVAYTGALMISILLWLFLTRSGYILSQALCALGVLTWIMIMYFDKKHFGFAPGLVGAMAVPLAGVVMMATTKRMACKAVYFALSGVVLWQLLSLYPVCGAQMIVPSGLGAALLPALVATCLSSGWGRATWRWRVVGHTIGWAGACAVIMVSLRGAVIDTKRYQGRVPLQLAGASWFRLAPVKAAEVQAIVANVQRYGTAFITQPGFCSFYPWTGVDYPSGYLATIYSKLLRPSELEYHLSRFPPQRQFLAIYSKSIMDFWLHRAGDGSDPVSSWLMAHTRPVYSGPVYQLRASYATPMLDPVHVAEVVAGREYALVSIILPSRVVEEAGFVEVFSKGGSSFPREKVRWLDRTPVGDGAWSRVELQLPWQVLKTILADDKVVLWLSSPLEPWLAGVIVAKAEGSHFKRIPHADQGGFADSRLQGGGDRIHPADSSELDGSF